MESSQRAALALVRLVAVCLIVISLLEIGLHLTEHLAPHNPVPLSVLRIALSSIPALIGIIILLKAKALAQWLSDLIE